MRLRFPCPTDGRAGYKLEYAVRLTERKRAEECSTIARIRLCNAVFSCFCFHSFIDQSQRAKSAQTPVLLPNSVAISSPRILSNVCPKLMYTFELYSIYPYHAGVPLNSLADTSVV